MGYKQEYCDSTYGNKVAELLYVSTATTRLYYQLNGSVQLFNFMELRYAIELEATQVMSIALFLIELCTTL